MLLALLAVAAAPAAELELGLGGQSLLPGPADPAARAVLRVVQGRVALDLSATYTPWAGRPGSLTHPMLGPSLASITERQDQLAVSLLGDWILGEAEGGPFTGSPHLYGGVSAWQAQRVTRSEWEMRSATERGLAPTLGGGLSVGLGSGSMRFMLTAAPRRAALGSGWDPMLRGSWDLIVRP